MLMVLLAPLHSRQGLGDSPQRPREWGPLCLCYRLFAIYLGTALLIRKRENDFSEQICQGAQLLRDKPERISHSFKNVRRAESRGAILAGDIIQVVPDRTRVGFMRSYPGFIPLSGGKVRRIAETLQPFRFDRVYGAWWDPHIQENAKAVLARSVDRNLEAITE